MNPISTHLESEVQARVARQGLVFWLDAPGTWRPFVDALAQSEPTEASFPIHVFRGSFLELLLELEPVAGGLDLRPTLVYLPGLTEARVEETPLLELFRMASRYERALPEVITQAAAGRVPPASISAFLERPNLTLADADAWLAAQLGGRANELAAQLEVLSPGALLDDLLGRGHVATRLADSSQLQTVWRHVAGTLGLPEAWRKQATPRGTPTAADVAFACASWALAVEYVADLRRPPVDARLAGTTALPEPVVRACQALAAHLRERQSAFYQRTADETEGWLVDEVKAARAEDLGAVDTFRFEEERLLEAALDAADRDAWEEVAAWAAGRLEGASVWLAFDPRRRSAWELLRGAARLAERIEAAGTTLRPKTDALRKPWDSLEPAVERYVAAGAAVDQAHRHLEQRREALLEPQIPSFERLRNSLDVARENWRCWAHHWAEDFNTLCREVGFLPPARLQQRHLFEEVVVPLCGESGATAYFVIDALRFEMATELYREMAQAPATTAQLHARLAELPTVTEVGMNALAPVARRGRLHPSVQDGVFKGFSEGEFRVYNPATRNRAMWNRVGGATCPLLTLDEVTSRDTTSLKASIARARLVVVHGTEIDAAGENGHGPVTFDRELQRLRAAWTLLREAGVRRFVITADHGFLMLSRADTPAQAHGRKVDPKRRHVVSPVAADHTHEARVPLSTLGYEGVDGLHLMFPFGNQVFDTGNRDMSFVHGGNSLQERVIPVLTVLHRAPAGSDAQTYAVTAQALEGVAGMHCIQAQVDLQSVDTLVFSGSSQIELAVRVVDVPGVTVELCQTREGATLEGSVVRATVGKRFELFFRLVGASDARAQIELHHPQRAAEVAPCVLDTRFAVAVARGGGFTVAPGVSAGPDTRWLDAFEGGVRQVFDHLQAHGAVTEEEVTRMLGGARQARRFAAELEHHAARAPFDVRVEAVAGVKRYVKEGGPR